MWLKNLNIMVFSEAKLDYENNNKPPSRVKSIGKSFIQSACTFSERNIKICWPNGANVPEGQKLGSMYSEIESERTFHWIHSAILKLVDKEVRALCFASTASVDSEFWRFVISTAVDNLFIRSGGQAVRHIYFLILQSVTAF